MNIFKIKILFSFLFVSLFFGISYGAGHAKTAVVSSQVATRIALKTVGYSSEFSPNASRFFLASVLGAALSDKEVAQNAQATLPGKADSVPVLLYHGIAKESDRFTITEDRFAEHMKALRDAGYQTVSIAEFRDFMVGNTTLTGRPILITFDDGRKDSYYGAHPILKALGYNATMFVAGSASLGDKKENNYYLSERELVKMTKSGVWEIQSHAMQYSGGTISVDAVGGQANFLSNKAWLADAGRNENDAEYTSRVFSELGESKKLITEKLNTPVFTFSYPFGDYGQQQKNKDSAPDVIKDTLSKTGYEIAFRQVWDRDIAYTHNYPGDPQFLLKRTEPSPEWSGAKLIEQLEAGEEKALPYSIDTFTDADWRISWGTRLADSTGMRVSAKDGSTGALTILDGTRAWGNYLFTTNIDWSAGSHVSLIGRFRDSSSYATCSFNDDRLRIEQYLNGKKRIMVEQKTDFEMPKKDVRLGMAVNDGKVQCLVNGNVVLFTYYLSPAMTQGGIGIKIWDETPDTANIVVKEVSATEMTGDGSDTLAQIEKTELVKKVIKTPSTKSETIKVWGSEEFTPDPNEEPR